MSVKRQATTQLHQENWDQEDEEQEDMGVFKSASKDVLDKRVIRTAKRRTQMSGDEAKKGVFSAFGGFNKTQPSSFDFLSNLTNGNKTNGAPDGNSDTVTSGLFSSKPNTSPASGGMFSTPVTSTTTSKATFGITNTQSSLFGGSSLNTPVVQPMFSALKTDTPSGSTPFKIPSMSNSTDSLANASNQNMGSSPKSLFGVPSTSANTNKSVFSTTASTNSTPFKIQPVTVNTTVPTNFGITKVEPEINSEKNNDKKMRYYFKLKGLNESVLDWIKKHVEETPLCILSPIFKDYENYLKDIQDEFQEDDSKKPVDKASPEPKSVSASTNSGSSLFSNTSSNPKATVFGNHDKGVPVGEKAAGFSFGINTANAANKTTSGGFTFGIKTSPTSAATTASPFSLGTNTMSTPATSSPFALGSSTSTTSSPSPFTLGSNTTTTSSPTPFSLGSNANTIPSTSPFSLAPNAPTNANSSAPFSFGLGKPFSFNSNIQVQKSTEQTNEGKEEDDEPPKVEFTPVVEENSVFDKRCKIFVKKDGNFVDKGVGTLYIKKVEETGKHQLLVRANTNLGNVMVNLILASGIPTQRLGKNNVMIVCIPTPDSKPPPTPILIRVKTSEEADELLETLNKFKA